MIEEKLLDLYDSANYRVRYKNRKITATDERSTLTKRHASNGTQIEVSEQEKKASRLKLHSKIREKNALIYGPAG